MGQLQEIWTRLKRLIGLEDPPYEVECMNCHRVFALAEGEPIPTAQDPMEVVDCPCGQMILIDPSGEYENRLRMLDAAYQHREKANAK